MVLAPVLIELESFESGNMIIQRLNGCTDDKTYTCEVLDNNNEKNEFATHTLIIGKCVCALSNEVWK